MRLITAFFLLLLAVFILASWHAPMSGASMGMEIGSPHSVVGSPDVSASQVDAILASVGSPANGTGMQLVSAASQYQIRVSFVLAMFRKESSDGTRGVATVTHALGNIRCLGWPGKCYEGYRFYNSYQDAYIDFCQLIRNQYINTWGLTTVNAIIPRYAPPSENDTVLYISQINEWMSQYTAHV